MTSFLNANLLRLAASGVIALLLTGASPAGDPMEPTSDPSSAIVSPLRIITLATDDLTSTRRFYQGALGMTPSMTQVTGGAAAALIKHWGLPPASSLQVLTFTRPELPEATVVRAIAVPQGTPVMRPDYNAEFTGALGMGVPVSGMEARDAVVTALGFKSAVGITKMDFPRADKTTYTVGEVHYLAPDNILVLSVDRADMRPVGPIDPALGIGGPSYSSALIDDAERAAPFFRDVLGLEMRREFTFQSKGPDGGMRLPAGTDVRFQQWFTPGSRTGYLVIMDLVNAGKRPPAPLGLQRRGIGMWSFETSDLQAIEQRARKAKASILKPAALIDAPGIGRVRSLVIATPDGFPIEVYMRLSRGAN